MFISTEQAEAFTAIVRGDTDHAGQAFNDLDAALMDILISRLDAPFERDIRDDRMLAMIAGKNVAVTLALVKTGGKVLMHQKIAQSEPVVVAFDTMQAALVGFEQTFNAGMPRALAVLRGDAPLN